MFPEESENAACYDITDIKETENLGKHLGKLITQSFKDDAPVKGLYLFGKIGIGKSILVKNIINSMEKNTDKEIDVARREDTRKYNMVYPNVLHNDYYSNRFSRFYESAPILNKNEMIIAEWADNLKDDFFDKDRIEIELLYLLPDESFSEKKTVLIRETKEMENPDVTRYATLIGYGNGIDVIEKLKFEF